MLVGEILYYCGGGTKPVYVHDCPNCRYVRTEDMMVAGKWTPCDVYLCRSPVDGSATLLFRYGDEPSEYFSYCDLSVKSMIIQAGIETLRRNHIKEGRLGCPAYMALNFASWQGKFTFEFLDEETEYPMW